MKNKLIALLTVGTFICSIVSPFGSLNGQSAMTNVRGRHCVSLNGKWQIIIDPVGAGDWRKIWQERKAREKNRFC